MYLLLRCFGGKKYAFVIAFDVAKYYGKKPTNLFRKFDPVPFFEQIYSNYVVIIFFIG